MHCVGGIRLTRLVFIDALCRSVVSAHRHYSRSKQAGALCGPTHAGVRGVVMNPSGFCLAPEKRTTLEEGVPRSMSLKCPECGKRFLSEANLRQHRRSRHFVVLKSPSQEHLERLRETNAQLVAALSALQKANTSKLSSVSSSSSLATAESSAPPDACKGAVYFPAAVPEGKAADMSMAQLRLLRDHPMRLGTGTPEVRCVGVVEDDVQFGVVGSAGEGVGGLETLQFTLRLEGHRQRRVGQLKMYCNRLTVRVVAPQYKTCKGDVVLVTGTYGLHKSYDLVSKQVVENVVVEAGYVGLLQRGGGTL